MSNPAFVTGSDDDQSLASTYPTTTNLFTKYIADQNSPKLWSERVVVPYRKHGEKPLEFKGLANELEQLSKSPAECARYLAIVLDVDQTPSAAHDTICETYDELIAPESSGQFVGVKVREPMTDTAGTIDAWQFLKLQLNAKVPRLPGFWGQITIFQYFIMSIIMAGVGTFITILLPVAVLASLGRVMILVGLVGAGLSAAALLLWRGMLLTDDEEAEEQTKKQRKPGRIRRFLQGDHPR